MKKMKKTLFAFAILSALTTISTAQNVDLATERGLMSKNISTKINAVGTPYVNEKYEPLKIKGFSDKVYSGRFNAYNGEMEVKLNEGNIIALDVKGNYEVNFVNSKKVYRTFSYESYTGLSRKGFLVVIGENEKFSLLKKEWIKYYEKVEAASSYQPDKPAKFRREDDRYYLKLGNAIKPFPSKKKDLLKAYPKHSKKIKSYIKENKLSTKKEKDLLKIAEYVSTL